ncbi:RNA polymerase, sigma-24 subunit, ECF subfamily [Modestobacter italicus]|uniref:RNA polymerase, sigma-24 subunit, ECF subfamily n=1 Tax=Modestobacter italicus (strain DSM 44449 / CECT 9708 / BC 501) TaxID=2732864 RepID=I4F0M3_MODI5|nr:sigma-70 family RNA polymerase sigma factor [Modestobacter marinus]CCH89186.1 RNA polymerase, sigma-24 subunit, ECF subfamily [Modestobacter marinus]
MSTDDEFAAMYRAHHAAVCRYVARRLNPAQEHEVRDVAAEVFTTAWRRRTVVPPEPLPWLYGVARRVLANERRGAQRRQRLADRLLADAPEQATPGVVIDRPAVLEALDQLSPSDQEVLALAAWEELGPADIAVVLRCSRSAASMRLHRARVRLREAMADFDPPPDSLARHHAPTPESVP